MSERYVITAIDREKGELDVELWDWTRDEGKKPRKLDWKTPLPANWPELKVGTQLLLNFKYRYGRIEWKPAKSAKKYRMQDMHSSIGACHEFRLDDPLERN